LTFDPQSTGLYTYEFYLLNRCLAQKLWSHQQYAFAHKFTKLHVASLAGMRLGYRMVKYPITAKAANARTAMIMPTRDIVSPLEDCSFYTICRSVLDRGDSRVARC
jgi:hypothetical protein